MKRKFVRALYLLICIAVALTGCGKKVEEKVEEKVEDDNFIATIGGVGITQEDYNLMYKSSFDNMSQYSQSYGEGWYNAKIDDDGTTIGSYMRNSTMDAIAELVAVEKLAEENNIKLNKSEVDRQIDSLKESKGGDEGYKEFLKEYRTNDEAVKKYFERISLYDNLFIKMSGEGGIAYVKNEDALSEFTDTYMRVQHILISTQEGRSESSALKLAKEVIAKLNGGADFDELIGTYNEDPGMSSGNYYTFTYGQMVSEFEEEAKNLNPGEYSKEPVKTDYGYHIIKKYDVVAQGQEFEEFRLKKSQEKVNEIIREKTEKLKTEKKNSIIDEYIEKWLKDLGVDTTAMPVTEGIQ